MSKTDKLLIKILNKRTITQLIIWKAFSFKGYIAKGKEFGCEESIVNEEIGHGETPILALEKLAKKLKIKI